MPTIIKPVNVVEVDYLCDDCRIGKMRHTGMSLMSTPAKYPHRCTHCNAHQNFNSIFPHTGHRKVEEAQVAELTWIGKLLKHLSYTTPGE